MKRVWSNLIAVQKYVFCNIPYSVVFLFCYMLVMGVLPAYQTTLSAEVINLISVQESSKVIENWETIFQYFEIFIGCYCLNQILTFFSALVINGRLFEELQADQRRHLTEKTSRIGLYDYEKIEIRDLLKRAENCIDNESIGMIYYNFIHIFKYVIEIVLLVVVLARYSIWLALPAVISTIPYFLTKKYFGRKNYCYSEEVLTTRKKVDYCWETIDRVETIPEVRMTTGFDFLKEKWEEGRNKVAQAKWKLRQQENNGTVICEMVSFIGYAFSIFMCLLMVRNSIMPAGAFGAALTAFLSMQNAIKELLSNLGGLSEVVAYAGDFFAALDISEEKVEDELRERLDSITIKNGFFRYPGCRENALKNINITIKKGERIVIVGENGSGKTTLVKVLSGLYPLESGELIVNNGEYKNIFEQLAYVGQNFVRYKSSIRENVGISNLPKIGVDSEIEKQLLAVNFNEQIDLDMQLGKEFGGTDLSGGQWQRLAVARALFADKEWNILDEPTSALDPNVENDILNYLVRIMKNKTTLIVAHRMGVCTLADRIIVMKDGSIVEQGSHKELMKNKDVYYRLYTEQSKWYA